MNIDNTHIMAIATKINEAIQEGYYPIEDTLNGPRTRVIPTKIRFLIKSGIKSVTMNSDEKGKDCYQIALV